MRWEAHLLGPAPMVMPTRGTCPGLNPTSFRFEWQIGAAPFETDIEIQVIDKRYRDRTCGDPNITCSSVVPGKQWTTAPCWAVTETIASLVPSNLCLLCLLPMAYLSRLGWLRQSSASPEETRTKTASLPAESARVGRAADWAERGGLLTFAGGDVDALALHGVGRRARSVDTM